MAQKMIITNEMVEKFSAYVKEQAGSGKTMAQLFEEFAKANGADITAEELYEILQNTPASELAPEMLEKVAGGCLLTPGDPEMVTGCCWGGCVTPDTLYTLSDGTQKRVDEITDEDRLLLWDFDKGGLGEGGITFFHRVKAEAPVLRAEFSDGTSVGIVDEHVFFDMTDRKFVEISKAEQGAELLGHTFARLADGQITGVTLTGLYDDGTTDSYYSPITEKHFNCFANGMLNISGSLHGFYNVFDLEEDELKYDAARKAAEIAEIGELPYEALSLIAPRALFDRNEFGWISVSIAKGLTSVEDLLNLLHAFRDYFIGEKVA